MAKPVQIRVDAHNHATVSFGHKGQITVVAKSSDADSLTSLLAEVVKEVTDRTEADDTTA